MKVPYILFYSMERAIEIEKYEELCSEYSKYGSSIVLLKGMAENSYTEKILQINYQLKMNTHILIESHRDMNNSIVDSYFGQISKAVYICKEFKQLESIKLAMKKCRILGIEFAIAFTDVQNENNSDEEQRKKEKSNVVFDDITIREFMKCVSEGENINYFRIGADHSLIYGEETRILEKDNIIGSALFGT